MMGCMIYIGRAAWYWGWTWVVLRMEDVRAWVAMVPGLLMTWRMAWTRATGGPVMCLRHDLSHARGRSCMTR